MAKVSEERERLEQEEDIKFKKFFNVNDLLNQKGHDYRNFSPVFSEM